MEAIGAKGKQKLSADEVTAIARALAEPRRFAILQQIAAKDTLLCSALDVQGTLSPATISHHLKELSEAGLIDIAREGRYAKLSMRRSTWVAYLNRLADF